MSHDLRPMDLPIVNWVNGLNRSSPLGDAGGPQIGEDSVTFGRLRTLENAKLSGTYVISMRRNKKIVIENFTFNLFQLAFTISVNTARA